MITVIRKDKLKRGVFSSLLFTDKTLFILAGIGIAAIDFVFFALLFRHIYWIGFWSFAALTEGIFYLLAMHQVDNQPMYKVAYRGLFYLASPSKLRGTQLGAYFTNFFIQDNLIMRRNSIPFVFKITPHEITGMSDGKRQQFFSHVRNSLNLLTTPMQIIVRKEFATKEDFTDHFLSLGESMAKGDSKREVMLRNYRRDLTLYVENNKLLMWKYYGAFSVDANTSNPQEKVRGVGLLHDVFKRYLTGIKDTKVKAQQLDDTELISLVKGTLR